MTTGMVRAMTLLALAGVLSGCIDHANAPVLVAVGNPVNPPDAVHGLCMADGNAMYDEATRQYKLRAAMAGRGRPDPIEMEATARAAARRQYVTCASAQGYRAIYPG